MEETTTCPDCGYEVPSVEADSCPNCGACINA